MIPQHEQVRHESQPELPPPLIVDTPEQLQVLQAALKGVTRVAFDTESNSLFAYRERVCLIQISLDQADFLLDPLAFDRTALSFLGELFANPAVEKVFHAAEYDVMVLRRDFGFDFANLFDTSLAARILGWQEIGLGSILEAQYGVRIDKRHQRANWGLRPLSPDMVRYAQRDTHYLLALRDDLYADLEARGYLEESRELSQEIALSVWSGGQFDPEGFWRMTGARTLTPRNASVLRELYLYRESQASHFDIPVFKVLADSVLMDIATRLPRSAEALRRIQGMTDGQVRRYGHGLLEAVSRGLAGPPLKPSFKRNGRDDLVMRRFDALHMWRKERALKRGVPSDIVMSKDVLWELAQVAPRTIEQLDAMHCLGPWRLSMYGEEVLQTLIQADQTPEADA
jgi:ribonuclease D